MGYDPNRDSSDTDGRWIFSDTPTPVAPKQQSPTPTCNLLAEGKRKLEGLSIATYYASLADHRSRVEKERLAKAEKERQRAEQNVQAYISKLTKLALQEGNKQLRQAVDATAKVAMQVLTEEIPAEEAITKGNQLEQNADRRLSFLGKLLVTLGLAVAAVSAAILAMKAITYGTIGFGLGAATALAANSFFRPAKTVQNEPSPTNIARPGF